MTLKDDPKGTCLSKLKLLKEFTVCSRKHLKIGLHFPVCVRGQEPNFDKHQLANSYGFHIDHDPFFIFIHLTFVFLFPFQCIVYTFTLLPFVFLLICITLIFITTCKLPYKVIVDSFIMYLIIFLILFFTTLTSQINLSRLASRNHGVIIIFNL